MAPSETATDRHGPRRECGLVVTPSALCGLGLRSRIGEVDGEVDGVLTSTAPTRTAASLVCVGGRVLGSLSDASKVSVGKRRPGEVDAHSPDIVRQRR